jgi:hypothetical protein
MVYSGTQMYKCLFAFYIFISAMHVSISQYRSFNRFQRSSTCGSVPLCLGLELKALGDAQEAWKPS